MEKDLDVTAAAHGASPALRAQEKKIRGPIGQIVDAAIAEERKKVAAYLEMAYGCGEPTCRSCIGKMLADAILDGEHDNEPRGLSASEAPTSAEAVTPTPSEDIP